MMNQQVKVIALSGKFHTHNLQYFQKNIADVLASSFQIVLIDCQNLTFMDSSGLGSLVLAFKTLEKANRRMIICSINEEIRILFELTGMDSIFEIVPNQEAVNHALLSMK